MKIGGWVLRIERAGHSTPPPSPVAEPVAAAKPARPMTAIEAYQKLMIPRTIVLPVTGIEVRLAPPVMRTLVDAGLTVAAMVPLDHALTEEEAAAHMARIRVQAQRLLCAASLEPVFRPRPKPGQLPVLLMPDEDLQTVFNLLIQWGTSIFYGTHRADLNPQDDPEWIEAQQQAAGVVDGLARRYGVLPTAIEALGPVEFARVAAYADAGEELERKAIETAKAKIPKPNPGGQRR